MCLGRSPDAKCRYELAHNCIQQVTSVVPETFTGDVIICLFFNLHAHITCIMRRGHLLTSHVIMRHWYLLKSHVIMRHWYFLTSHVIMRRGQLLTWHVSWDLGTYLLRGILLGGGGIITGFFHLGDVRPWVIPSSRLILRLSIHPHMVCLFHLN